MPNWCQNKVELFHEDSNMIKRAIAAYHDDKLFNEFVPRPESEDDNWYDWNLSNWGTKWDMSGCDYIESSNDNSIEMEFSTAWGAPLEFYNNLIEQGFEVHAYYYEPGVGFCGYYSKDSDEVYHINGNSEWVTKNIPESINDIFLISESMKEWEEDEE